jgi:hypothetical protein
MQRRRLILFSKRTLKGYEAESGRDVSFGLSGLIVGSSVRGIKGEGLRHFNRTI